MEEERRQTGLKSAAAESRLSRYYLKRIMTLENVHRYIVSVACYLLSVDHPMTCLEGEVIFGTKLKLRLATFSLFSYFVFGLLFKLYKEPFVLTFR